jgi:hypothetical protein
MYSDDDSSNMTQVVEYNAERFLEEIDSHSEPVEGDYISKYDQLFQQQIEDDKKHQLTLELLDPVNNEENWQKAEIVSPGDGLGLVIDYPADAHDAEELTEEILENEDNRQALQEFVQHIIDDDSMEPTGPLWDETYLRFVTRLAQSIDERLQLEREQAEEYMRSLASSEKNDFLGIDPEIRVEGSVQQRAAPSPDASMADDKIDGAGKKAVTTPMEGNFKLHIGNQTFDIGHLEYEYGIRHKQMFNGHGDITRRQTGITGKDLKGTSVDNTLDIMEHTGVLPKPAFIFKAVLRSRIANEINKLSAKSLGLNHEKLAAGSTKQTEKLKLISSGMTPEMAAMALLKDRKNKKIEEPKPAEKSLSKEEPSPELGFDM